MTSKHHRWQTRWRIDLATNRAMHECGLVIQFARPDSMPGAWDGAPVDDPDVMAQLLTKHGPHNIGPHLARLMREAGQLFKEAHHAQH